jgi:hypothetical protein
MLDSSIGSTARKKHKMPFFLKQFRLFAQILECCLMNLFTCVVCVVIFRGGNINVIFFASAIFFFLFPPSFGNKNLSKNYCFKSKFSQNNKKRRKNRAHV